jgi:flagellar biosynthesis/type III secretory pathway protein FliH
LQQRNEMVELQNGVVASLRLTVPQVVNETESTLINLALESAQKIIAGMPVSAEMIEAVVREAVREIEDAAEITIQLHPEDLALLRKHNSPLRGGCIVQTRFGLIDARRETKLEQLRQILT